MDRTPLVVVDESTDWLVVDKPAGLVCHPTKHDEWSSLIGRVRLHLGHDQGRLVNRLDRETSGLVLIARHREAARDLGRLLAGAEVEKSYLGIVHGRLSAPLVSVARLGRDERSAVAVRDGVRADGAAAETRVLPVSTFSRGPETFSVVQIAPRTGRKHQIRIHLSHAGFPIVGDKIYGGDETRYLRLVTGALTDEDRRALVLPYHALHAAALACTIGGRRHHWRAAEPARLRRLRAGESWEQLWEDARHDDPRPVPDARGSDDSRA